MISIISYATIWTKRIRMKRTPSFREPINICHLTSSLCFNTVRLFTRISLALIPVTAHRRQSPSPSDPRLRHSPLRPLAYRSPVRSSPLPARQLVLPEGSDIHTFHCTKTFSPLSAEDEPARCQHSTELRHHLLDFF